MKKLSFILMLMIALPAIAQKSKKLNQASLVKVGEGWAKNSVNTVVFRRNSLVTDRNTQYIAYYNADQYIVLGKRQLGSKKWELLTSRYKGNATDAHRSISIMVDGAGYLHVSWDHHNTRLKYCRSVAPGSLELSAEEPMTAKQENKVTYPEFYRLPSGNLLFFYRDGSSGNGNLMLNHYNFKTKKWTQVQNGWINGEGQRNAYWQMTTDKLGTIHLSWVWRETGDVSTNHDLCYARSKDEGLTWEKSTGEKYVLPVTQARAEYACRIPQNSELINTTSMSADDQGRPYIATYWRKEDSKVPQYWMVYHDGQKWITTQISDRKEPFTLAGSGTKRIPISRPQLVMLNRKGRTGAVMVFRDEERGNKVSIAVRKDISKGKWEISDLTSGSFGQWEPSYDTELWQQKGLLHVFLENVVQADAEHLAEQPAQQVYVLEWKPE